MSITIFNNSNNAANDNVEFVAEVAPFVRRPLNSNSLFLIYSPFYGKINTFNQIYYFDVSFGLGTGTYNMESNLKTATDPTQNKFETETYTPVQVKATTKIHLNKNLHLGMEFLSTNFQAEDDPSDQNKKTWTRHNDIIFSIGVSF